jgi:hypothetical protein
MVRLTKKEKDNCLGIIDFLTDLERQLKTPDGWKRFNENNIIDWNKKKGG